jgi:predicted enzyme related to lactoylglutathione lyase
MGRRTSYPPGAFCWVDAATTDAAAAKSFYTALFGWEMKDNDAGDGAVYTTCRIGGDAFCGLYEMSEEMRARGARPNWTSYVNVADADAAVARAKELGGEVVDEAFDVLDIGSMAVLKDPQGRIRGLAAAHADRGRARQRRRLPLHERTRDDRPRRGALLLRGPVRLDDGGA